jgi:hypothetical protein
MEKITLELTVNDFFAILDILRALPHNQVDNAVKFLQEKAKTQIDEIAAARQAAADKAKAEAEQQAAASNDNAADTVQAAAQ